MPAAQSSKHKATKDGDRKAGAGRSPSRKGERKVYKSITVTAASPESYSDAVRVAIDKARETVRRLAWWEVIDQRGRLDPDSSEIMEFQLTLAIHFEVE
jgi:flavin-binding protein dodecin